VRRLPPRHLSVSFAAKGEGEMLEIGIVIALAAAAGGQLSVPFPEVIARSLYFEEHAANRRSLWSASPLLSRYPRFLKELRDEAVPAVRLTAEDCVETLPCYTAIQHQLSFAGERLVTVFAEQSGFHGGAHGGESAAHRIWDQHLGRIIPFRDIFTSWDSARPVLQARLCEELRRRRREREFECPPIDDVAIGLSDRSGVPTGGRADALEIRTSDYQLGSYADGRETGWIEMDAALLALVKPEYRAEFITYE
jgi:hypothetical protein